MKPAVTVLVSPDGSPINKVFDFDPDGKLRKGMARNRGAFRARTVEVDLRTLAELFTEVGGRADATASVSVFKDPPADTFNVLSMADLAAKAKLSPGRNPGWYEVDGEWYVARIKENLQMGAFLLFDGDPSADMSEAQQELMRDREWWYEAMGVPFPGFEKAGKVLLPSASNRITVDGQRQKGSPSFHCYVQVTNPADIQRAWACARLRSLISETKDWDDTSVPLWFKKPKYDRKGGTGEVVAMSWGAIWDVCTAEESRLVFEGAPHSTDPRIGILPPDVQFIDGPPLDLSLVPDLTEDEERQIADVLETVHKVRPTFDYDKALPGEPEPGKVRYKRVVGISIVVPDLDLDMEVEQQTGGWTTVRQLHESGAGKTRIQSPYRESTSWAAVFNRHTSTGSPFVFDSGTGERHVLPGGAVAASAALMWEIISDWFKNNYQPKHRTEKGMIFCEAEGRRLSVRDIGPHPEVLELMAGASDAPRNKQGVRTTALPVEFGKYMKVAWAWWLRELPLELDVANLSSEAAEEHIVLVTNLLSSTALINYGTGTHSASLGCWTKTFAHMGDKDGSWSRVKTLPLWGRVTEEGLQIALWPSLVTQAQARNCQEIGSMTRTMLSRLSKAAGIGEDSTHVWTKAEGQFRATILKASFVETLGFIEVNQDNAAELNQQFHRVSQELKNNSRGRGTLEGVDGNPSGGGSRN